MTTDNDTAIDLGALAQAAEAYVGEETETEVQDTPSDDGQDSSPETTPTVSTTPEPSQAEVDLQTRLDALETEKSAWEVQRTEYTKQQQEANRQARTAQLKTQSDTYKNQLTNRGIDEETAQYIASNQANAQQQVYSMQAEFEARYTVAQMVATKHSIDMNSIVQLDSPDAMEAEARRLSEVSTLRTEMDELRKQINPPQAFDTTQGKSANEPAADKWLFEVYGRGRSDDHARAAKVAKQLGLDIPLMMQG